MPFRFFLDEEEKPGDGGGRGRRTFHALKYTRYSAR